MERRKREDGILVGVVEEYQVHGSNSEGRFEWWF